jgi:hypothetical protein
MVHLWEATLTHSLAIARAVVLLYSCCLCRFVQAYWVRLYLLGERGEAYDMVYGKGSSSLCHYAEMASCLLEPSTTAELHP